jgi:hypothetical protein
MKYHFGDRWQVTPHIWNSNRGFEHAMGSPLCLYLGCSPLSRSSGMCLPARNSLMEPEMIKISSQRSQQETKPGFSVKTQKPNNIPLSRGAHPLHAQKK